MTEITDKKDDWAIKSGKYVIAAFENGIPAVLSALEAAFSPMLVRKPKSNELAPKPMIDSVVKSASWTAKIILIVVVLAGCIFAFQASKLLDKQPQAQIGSSSAADLKSNQPQPKGEAK